MSLKFFLYCRQNYDNIIREIDEIINQLTQIELYTYNESNLEVNIFDKFNTIHDKSILIVRREKFMNLKKICNEKISKICDHEFVEDDIDIFPEMSQRIKYCEICEYTEK